jgi:hypothetical protein
MRKVNDDVATVKALRMLKGLSRQDAAQLVGVSRVAFEQIFARYFRFQQTLIRGHLINLVIMIKKSLGFYFNLPNKLCADQTILSVHLD